MQSINHPLTVSAVKAFEWNIVKQSKRPNRFNSITGPGNTWRHGLTNRKPDNLYRGRSRMANESVAEQHFRLLEDTLDNLNLKDKPQNVFNMDESMVDMDQRSGRVVVSRKTKHT